MRSQILLSSRMHLSKAFKHMLASNILLGPWAMSQFQSSL